ncbi:hypothetical protein M758_9G094700 [Ceratodon purpureus]|nr:hypothetical protein M758_9G094700 [Ceratodon purpureus]
MDKRKSHKRKTPAPATDDALPVVLHRGELKKREGEKEEDKWKHIRDKKLKGEIIQREKLFGEAAETATKFQEWLLPSEAGYLEAEGLEDTRHFSQEAIVKEVDVTSARKAFDLQLPDLGPYHVDYNANGVFMLLGGRKGHLAMMDWKKTRLMMEFQVRETIRDVKFLHNETFFAVAQKKYVFIYDRRGVELHCMRDHIQPLKLEFLPHHFLLASIDKAGILRYQDTSTGVLLTQHRTHLGRGGVMRMNPYNSVLGLGHSNGTVTMWSPNMSTPLVSMLCHRGPVTSVAYDSEGVHMVTGGMDGKVKVWDVRKFLPLHTYFAPTTPKSIEISQKGLVAVGCGSKIEIWRDALSTKQVKPYLSHRLAKGAQVEDLAFCPYEDVLGTGHSAGISSLLVPGAGEPNFDTYVANPYETLKQRREAEVHRLLDKLPSDTIALDPNTIGGILQTSKDNQLSKVVLSKEANKANAIAAGKEVKLKNKMKGKNKPSRRHKRKQLNVITAEMAMKREMLEKQKSDKKNPAASETDRDSSLPLALARFQRK